MNDSAVVLMYPAAYGAASEGDAPSWDEASALLEILPGLTLDERAAAVRRLLRSSAGSVRQRALQIGSVVLSETELVEYIRNGTDDVLRNAGLEMLKLRGETAARTACELLNDSDRDVALQAILVLDALHSSVAIPPLISILIDPDPNLVQAAITALGHCGDAVAGGWIVPFLTRDPWLQFAAAVAVGDLRYQAALPVLATLIEDPFLGPVAAESIGRIGGRGALQLLLRNWEIAAAHLGLERLLEVVAEIVECSHPGAYAVEILDRVAGYVAVDRAAMRCFAARIILACGPGEMDRDALHALVAHADPTALPSCLKRRRDLAATLLLEHSVPRAWAFELLLESSSEGGSDEALALAIAQLGPRDVDELLVSVLRDADAKAVAMPVLELFLRCDEARQELLIPVLRHHAAAVRPLLRSVSTDEATLLILASACGFEESNVRARILALATRDQLRVVRALVTSRATISVIPWRKLFDASPDAIGPLLARAAVETRSTALRKLLREAMSRAASVDVIRAVGILGDAAAVPQLRELLQTRDEYVHGFVVEALGRIGTREARAALLEQLPGNSHSRRCIMGALASGASGAELAVFRDAVSDPDWMVRLACVEALSHSRTIEDRALLALLSVDPIDIVAARARERSRA